MNPSPVRPAPFSVVEAAAVRAMSRELERAERLATCAGGDTYRLRTSARRTAPCSAGTESCSAPCAGWRVTSRPRSAGSSAR